MPEKLRVAVIGAGLIGREHIRFVTRSTDVTLIAVADSHPAAQEVADDAGARFFPDYRAMLDAVELDAVIIAVPNQLHATVALDCIDRGLPMLLEKPIAATIDEGAAIVRASKSTGVPVLIGHHRRHSPDMMQGRASVRNGMLGAPLAVNGMWLARKDDAYFDVEWRRTPGVGGPILINLIHEIDCLRYIVGEIASVRALSRAAGRGLAVEDTTAILLEFESGVLGTFVMSDATPSPWIWDITSGRGAYFPHVPGNCFFIAGTRGSLALPQGELWTHPDGEAWHQPPVRTQLELDDSDCYDSQLAHFVEVARGRANPICDAEDGLASLAVVDAVISSIATGADVRVAEVLGRATPAP